MAAVAVMNNPAVDVVEAPSLAEKKFGGQTMLIANPLYDDVFKYMMNDRNIAKLVISTLMDEDITDLRPNQQERPNEYVKFDVKGREVPLQRLDYTADIETVNGKTALLIEMQMNREKEALLRFQRYIAEQFVYASNREKDDDIHQIRNIFIWGNRIIRSNDVVIETNPKSHNPATGKDKMLKNNRIDNSMHHRSWNIQVVNLGKNPPASETERMLAMFDQKYCTKNKHHLEVPLDDVPEKFHPVLYRLSKAAADPNVRRQMTAQDEFDRFIEQQREEDRAEVRKEMEGIIAQKDHDLAQTTQELETERRKNQELAERLALLENPKSKTQ